MSARCLFVSDLHGSARRVGALLREILATRPGAVFVGGDLLPAFGGIARRADLPPSREASASLRSPDGGGQVRPGDRPDLQARRGGRAELPDADDFLDDMAAAFVRLREAMGPAYPSVFVILGNDDPRIEEERLRSLGAGGLWTYAHACATDWRGWRVFGYSYVPPTPFRLKDWERYDVSRYVDPGCVSPEEGFRTTPLDARDARHATIASDLAALAGDAELARTIWLFHAPPYRTALDRAALDGKSVDHAPLDVHVGSIAIRRFIERRQPPVTLHGHIHESARITGRWRDQIGGTVMLSAAHDGPELALVGFDPECPHLATRDLIAIESPV